MGYKLNVNKAVFFFFFLKKKQTWFATCELWDLGQVFSLLCASFFTPVKWGHYSLLTHRVLELKRSVKFLEQWLTRVSPVTAVLQGFVVTGVGGLESVLLNPKAHVLVTEFCQLPGPDTAPCQPARAKSTSVA